MQAVVAEVLRRINRGRPSESTAAPPAAARLSNLLAALVRNQRGLATAAVACPPSSVAGIDAPSPQAPNAVPSSS